MASVDHLRLRAAARMAKDAIEQLVSNPSAPDTLERLNKALLLLRTVFKDERA